MSKMVGGHGCGGGRRQWVGDCGILKGAGIVGIEKSLSVCEVRSLV